MDLMKIYEVHLINTFTDNLNHYCKYNSVLGDIFHTLCTRRVRRVGKS